MSWKPRTLLGGFGMAVGMLVAVVWSQEPAKDSPNASPSPEAAQAATLADAGAFDSVEVARQKAKLMHEIYTATLDVMHHRYFRNDRSTVPARAMEDVFSEIAHQSKIQSRWIGVNAKTMGLNHEPKDGFEKDAAAAIGAGKGEFELVADGHYRRASAIPLTSGCLTCHGSFGFEPKTPRFAGLVIDIPLKQARGK